MTRKVHNVSESDVKREEKIKIIDGVYEIFGPETECVFFQDYDDGSEHSLFIDLKESSITGEQVTSLIALLGPNDPKNLIINSSFIGDDGCGHCFHGATIGFSIEWEGLKL